MKHRRFYTSLIGFLLASYSFAQKMNVEQVTLFSSRIKDPIVYDVKSDANNIYFTVINKSFFPYGIEINFTECKNLSPQVYYKKTIAQPGSNRLFTFKIIDKNVSPSLLYKTKYYLAKAETASERFNQYLVPIGKYKTVKLFQINQEGSKHTFVDQFIMNDGDTVFCSRKGFVTATPDNRDEIDRVMENSLEIRHVDGSIAVYLGLDQTKLMVSMGQKIFPGQPLGTIGNSRIMTFKIFEIQDEGKLQAIKTYFSGLDKKVISQDNINGTKADFPIEVIKKEMTKREKEKYNRNSLF
jgi:hypothetical protein